eukprot:485415_1
MKFQTAFLVVAALFAVQMIGESNASRFNMKAGSEKASGIELEGKKSCDGAMCTNSSECCKKYECNEGKCFRIKYRKKCGAPCTIHDECTSDSCPECITGICQREN